MSQSERNRYLYFLILCYYRSMSKEEFKPDHPNANIHGMIGANGSLTCLTREGNLCTGCCTTFRVPEFNVEADKPCQHQTPGRGCKILNDPLRKRVCGSYHCSRNADFYGGKLSKAQQNNINFRHLVH